MRKLLALAALLPAVTFAAEPFGLRGVELGKPFDHAALPDCAPDARACDGLFDVLTFKGLLTLTADTDGAVNSITFSFDSGRYSELRSALVQKYGLPREAGQVHKQNVYGAALTSRAMVWRQEGAEMLLDDHTELSNGSLTIRRLEVAQKSVGL